MRRVRNDQAGQEQTDGGRHSSPVIDLGVAGAGSKKLSDVPESHDLGTAQESSSVRVERVRHLSLGDQSVEPRSQSLADLLQSAISAMVVRDTRSKTPPAVCILLIDAGR